MFEIIPSPGTTDKEWSAIEKKIEMVKPFAKTLHIDVIDGKFADNTTFLDPEPFKKYADTFLLEVHLMVEEPINYIHPWAAAGFKRFIGQIEKMSDQAAFVAQGEQAGEVGLAIDGPTGLDKLTISPLDLDVLLIMTIQAGFSGQEFQPKQLEKIKQYTETYSLSPIEIDGGINEGTIGQAFEAGARRFVSTSAIFNATDPAAAFKNMHDTCQQLLGREYAG